MDRKLNLFGVIYPADDCVNAEDVSKFLNSLGPDEEFTVYINSPGGSVFEGLAIYNLLAEYASRMTIKIIGEASSIASVIACAATEGKTLIAETALMLIHKPWTFAIVDEDYINKLQKELGTIKGSIIKAYQRKTDRSEDELNDLMVEAEYHDAEECTELGFADKVYVPSDEDTKLKKESDKAVKQNLSKFMIMNLNQNISKPSKEKYSMTIEEALAKIGELDAKVASLDKVNAEQKELLAKHETEVRNLKDENSKLKQDNGKLANENKEYSEKLNKQQQDIILAEETEFCNKLINDMKLAPAEKDTQIKVLVNFRNNPDAMFDENTKMYDHLRASLEAREPLTSLKQPPTNNDPTNQNEEFNYSEDLWNTAEGRAKIHDEVMKRAKANDTDYETELNNLKEGV